MGHFARSSMQIGMESEDVNAPSQLHLPRDAGPCRQESLFRCTNPLCILLCSVFPQPLKTMKSVCSGSACDRGRGKGPSGAGSTRSMATSSWPLTFGSPPTAPTAEISSGKPLPPGNLWLWLLCGPRVELGRGDDQ